MGALRLLSLKSNWLIVSIEHVTPAQEPDCPDCRPNPDPEPHGYILAIAPLQLQLDNDVEVEGAKDGALVVTNGDNVGARVGDAVGLDAEGQLVITFLKLHSAFASFRCCSEG